jgi:prepilin-type N-terminal cleavage/methylation domain-containing protein
MHKKLTQQRNNAQAGFTIVELMVATMVFSVILVVITVGVMYFTRSYYKGVYAGMTQNATRDITGAVTQAVQFGTGEPSTYEYKDTDTGGYFCAGGYVFVFDLGKQYDVTNSGTSGMYMQPMTGSCSESSTAGANPASSRRQLLGDRMRIAYLNFVGGDGLYSLDVKVAYGDDDVLLPAKGSDAQCNLGSGSEYCAIARYTTSIRQRKT